MLVGGARAAAGTGAAGRLFREAALKP
jgi:hypothetical protein